MASEQKKCDSQRVARAKPNPSSHRASPVCKRIKANPLDGLGKKSIRQRKGETIVVNALDHLRSANNRIIKQIDINRRSHRRHQSYHKQS